VSLSPRQLQRRLAGIAVSVGASQDHRDDHATVIVDLEPGMMTPMIEGRTPESTRPVTLADLRTTFGG